MPLHRAAMTREPIGTTRKGQVLLGALGLIAGVGGGLGLETRPTTFEPILRIALYGLGALLRVHVYYESSERIFFAILLAALGTIWALVLARAFIREPARNRMIDAYLMRQSQIDQARRATVDPQNNP